MSKRRLIASYLALDVLAAMFAWVAFFILRKVFVDGHFNSYHIQFIWNDYKLYLGAVLIPIFWCGLYAIFGLYKNVFRKSRLKEFLQVFFISLLGVLILFFSIILDDEVGAYQRYYQSLGVLFLLHYVPTALFRMVLTTRIVKRIQSRVIGFKTLLIGSGTRAKDILNELLTAKKSEGNLFQGFVTINGEESVIDEIPLLGTKENIQSLIQEHEIKEVIIATEENQKEQIPSLISILTGEQLTIKIIPTMYQHLAGMVKIGNVFGAVLIEIKTDVLPAWQKSVKRIFDIVVSTLILVFGLPFYVLIAILVKMGSKGPAFFKQTRIGLHGKPFTIYKFRSMKLDAEASGPKLAKEDDPRVTKFGTFLRKTRLDEFPQFYNVLRGDMSIVGPRPERQFFIDQIVQKAPHYKRLHKIKPGITSWGQVKFGYAENVDEMVDRLKYDLLYLENISLQLDLKILIYTLLIMIQGRGK